MINSVYKTVLAILNKNNFGYIAPADFNLYAKQAQLDMFQNYFTGINKQINLENARQSGTDYANLTKKIAENIEIFSVSNFLSNSSLNKFYLPSLITTGDVAYTIGKVLCYTNLLATGNSTTGSPSNLTNTAGAFTSKGISVGDIVINGSTQQTATVVSVISSTVVSISSNIFTSTGELYYIYSASSVKEAEKISQAKITQLNTSLLTTPNVTFPAYTMEGNLIIVYPLTINSFGKVQAQYMRYPADPKWTYVSLSGGEPSFDASAVDYKDFEIPDDEEPELIVKILEFAGLSIREAEVVNFALNEENKQNAK